MPTSRVRLGDTGEVVTVEHQTGASPDEIKRLARQPRPRPTTHVARPTEPDVVARAHRALTAEPPMGARTGLSRTLFGEKVGSFDYPGRVVRSAGDLFLPTTVPESAAMAATLPVGGNVLTAPLKRIAAGGLAGGGTALAQGKDWASSLVEGGRLGLSQFAGELLPGALRFGLTQKAGQRALAGHESRVAHDRAMHEAVTGVEAERYKADVATRRSAEAARVREARAQFQEQRRDLTAKQEEATAAQSSAVAARRSAEAARVREARAQYQEQVRDVTSRHEQAVTAQARTHEAATAAAQATHEAHTRAYAEQGAQTIAESFKAQVSAWRDFPSNEQGLLGMVYGEGQAKLSAVYDAVMKDIAQLGKGRAVEIPLKDAQALRIRFWDTRGPVQRGMPDITRVDASQLAEAATGYWKKNPGVYRRAVGALDALDIGDPAARAEYKAGQALIQFTDKTKMLKGETFNPEAARAGFTELKKVDELRRRGQGDIFQGPIAEAVRRPAPELRLPTEPAPLTPPTQPVFRRPTPLPEIPPGPASPKIPVFRRPTPLPEVEPPPKRVLIEKPTPEGLEFKTVPNIKWWQAAAIAEIPAIVAGLATGHHGYGGYGLPLAAGAVAAGASGRRVITKAPLSPLGQFASDLRLEQPLAQEARRATGPSLAISPHEGPSTADIDRQMRERFGPKP